ncbi:hypothetical protein E4T47_01975 [Aureobasidium subglaciale]|nr:hypothetical protein E4T47_01975 [Aureobasidium subglaciale]
MFDPWTLLTGAERGIRSSSGYNKQAPVFEPAPAQSSLVDRASQSGQVMMTPTLAQPFTNATKDPIGRPQDSSKDALEISNPSSNLGGSQPLYIVDAQHGKTTERTLMIPGFSQPIKEIYIRSYAGSESNGKPAPWSPTVLPHHHHAPAACWSNELNRLCIKYEEAIVDLFTELDQHATAMRAMETSGRNVLGDDYDFPDVGKFCEETKLSGTDTGTRISHLVLAHDGVIRALIAALSNHSSALKHLTIALDALSEVDEPETNGESSVDDRAHSVERPLDPSRQVDDQEHAIEAVIASLYACLHTLSANVRGHGDIRSIASDPDSDAALDAAAQHRTEMRNVKLNDENVSLRARVEKLKSQHIDQGAMVNAQAATISAMQSRLVVQKHTKSALQNEIVAHEAKISARDATITTRYGKIVAQKDLISSRDDTMASLREKIGVLQVKENERRSGSSWFK